MKKFFHQYNRKLWLVFFLSLIVGMLVLPILPENIPIHFGPTGEADSFGSRWSIFLAPGINFILIFLTDELRKIDPKSENYKKFASYYYNTIFIVSLLMFGIQLITILYVFDYGINIARVMPVILGLMFIFLGNIMPKFKHNYFVGIKTSWTLASEKVWYLTHRFAGKVWLVGGFLMVFTGFLPVQAIVWACIIIAIFLVILPVGASYYFFNKHEK